MNQELQKNQYFEFRNITPDFYAKSKIQNYLKKKLPKDKHSKILDIGCGLGQTLEALKTMGYVHLKGIDISNGAVTISRQKGLDVEKTTKITAYIPLEKFDFIIMSHVLEHIEKAEIIETLTHIKDHLLQDAGCLAVMVPNAQSNTGCYWAFEDFTHTTLFTAGSLYYVLRCAGFTSVEFIDPTGIEKIPIWAKGIFYILLKIYTWNKLFWNIATLSSYHHPSLQIFTYELKALAKK